MKLSPTLKNNFLFFKKAIPVILGFPVLMFACKKDKTNGSKINGNTDAFFNYKGSDTLVIKTIGQLKIFNDRVPFADSLSTIGTIEWNAYIKSVGVSSLQKNLYKIMVLLLTSKIF